MPRGVESFAIGKRNRDRVRRVVPRGGASRRPARELLSPPTEGTHFVPTYGEIVSQSGERIYPRTSPPSIGMTAPVT